MHKAAAHDPHRADRVDRHGQVDRRRDVRRGAAFRCSTPTPRCARMQGHGGSLVEAIEARFPGTTGRRRGRPRRARRARCSATATSSPRWKRSSIPAVHAARAALHRSQQRRAGPAVRHSLAVRNRRRGRVRQGDRRLGPGRRCSASGCSRAPGMTADKLDADPRPANARRREARARRFRHRHRRQPIEDTERQVGCDPRLSRASARRDKRGHAGNHFRHRDHRAQPGGRRPAWSRSAASKWSTGSRPAATSTLISIPSGRCRARPRRSTACPTSSCRTSRVFVDQAEELLEFIGDSPLVAHNAAFDFGFLNHELQRCGRDAVCMSRMVDTLILARARHPGAKHSLDALCTPLRRRPQPARQAWRLARRAIARAGLCRADRRPPDRPGLVADTAPRPS